MNQLAITQPIQLASLKPAFADEEVRQFPDARYPFLRFQIGRKVSRGVDEPRFEGKSVIGYFRTGKTVSVFELIGFGSTLEAAQIMARRVR